MIEPSMSMTTFKISILSDLQRPRTLVKAFYYPAGDNIAIYIWQLIQFGVLKHDGLETHIWHLRLFPVPISNLINMNFDTQKKITAEKSYVATLHTSLLFGNIQYN